MDEGSETVAGSRRGAYLLLAAALLVAGILAWRTLSDAGGNPLPAVSEVAPPTIEELQARTQADPGDAEAWQELGYAYFAQERFGDAVTAYEGAVQADPESAILWSALGEARIYASARDPMPAAAIEAFEKASSIDPADERARYFLAVRKDLNGDHDGAISDWLALLEDTPPGAAWESNLVRTIEQVGKINEIPTEDRIATVMAGRSPMAAGPAIGAAGNLPGPSQAQIAAAGSISPSEQREMALGMVERLEQRLGDDPANIDGWVMLMRSRMTLGEPDKARKALTDAIAANPSETARLRQEGEALGVR
jgi:cytochrome c-type biogenesis protein CcmH